MTHSFSTSQRVTTVGLLQRLLLTVSGQRTGLSVTSREFSAPLCVCVCFLNLLLPDLVCTCVCVRKWKCCQQCRGWGQNNRDCQVSASAWVCVCVRVCTQERLSETIALTSFCRGTESDNVCVHRRTPLASASAWLSALLYTALLCSAVCACVHVCTCARVCVH